MSDGLFNFDLQAFKDALAEKESQGRGDYKAVNRYGYLGRYQLGAKALADAGLVKRGTSNRGLKNPRNWLQGNRNEFLASPDMQESALEKVLQLNAKRAMKHGLFDVSSPGYEQAGVLAGMHLVGAKGFRRSLDGMDVKDANNVRPVQYYQHMVDRLGPKDTGEDYQYNMEQQMPVEQPWYVNPLQAGKDYFTNLFK